MNQINNNVSICPAGEAFALPTPQDHQAEFQRLQTLVTQNRIDCFGILDDAKIRRYFELGCEVKALGRGHIQRIKEEVRRGR